MLVEWQAAPTWVAAGWTMVHLLWLGTGSGLMSLVLGWALMRSASPQCRYGFSLVMLLALGAVRRPLHATKPQAPRESGRRLLNSWADTPTPERNFVSNSPLTPSRSASTWFKPPSRAHGRTHAVVLAYDVFRTSITM